MDDLVAALVAEERLDLTGVDALDPVHLRGRVVDEPARELAAARPDAPDAVADAEAALDARDARGQETPPAARQRALGALVDVERARGLQGVGDPVLPPAEAVAVR